MTGGEKPLISVILITWNRSRFLAKAIESVMNQTLGSWELIIIDDASQDDTCDVVRTYSYEKRIRYLKNSGNRGSIFSRNRGISESTGAWIAILDDDDTWMHDKLERQYEITKKFPEAGVIFARAHYTDDDGNVSLTVPRTVVPLDQPLPGFEIFRILALKGNCIPHSTMVFRRELAIKYPYTPGYSVTDDWLLYLTLSSRNIWFYGLSKPLARINRGEKHMQLTSSITDNLDQGLKILTLLDDIVPPENQELLGKLLKNRAQANFLVRFRPKMNERAFYWKALTYYPFHIYAWKKWASTIMESWKKR